MVHPGSRNTVLMCAYEQYMKEICNGFNIRKAESQPESANKLDI